MTPTSLQLTDDTTKWGWVTLVNKDNTINRQYAISGADADALARNAIKIPPGCTQAEWSEAGRSMSVTMAQHVGQARIVGDRLIVLCGVFPVKTMRLEPDEYQIDGGVISVLQRLVKEVDVPYQEVTP